MPCPMEFRIAVAADYDPTGSPVETAETFGCCEAWVRRLIQRRRRRETGPLELPPPREAARHVEARRGGPRAAGGAGRGRARHDAGGAGRGAGAQGERADRLARDAAAGPAAQNKAPHAAEQGRPDVRAARGEWHGLPAGVRPDQPVSLGEFGATANVTRRYARGPVGERAVCRTPRGRWKVLGTTAAMTVRGVLCSGTSGGATGTDTFVAFVRDGLVPTPAPGQVVTTDNLPAHRSATVDDPVEAAGCYVLRLPPCSPDLNPIGMAASKVKALLRRAERRSIDALRTAIGEALSSITPADAIAFARHCGYGDTHA